MIRDPLKVYAKTFAEVEQANPDLDPLSEEFIGLQVQNMLDKGCTEQDLKFAFHERVQDPETTDNLIEDAVFSLESEKNGPTASVESSALSETPTFRPEIYDRLPLLIRKGISAFNDDRQKDIFTISGLAALGSCIAKVEGDHIEELHPTLYTFVVAPPASGKSGLNYIQHMLLGVHQYHITESSGAAIKFRQKEKAGEATIEEMASPPKKRYHIIPGNSSGAKIIEHLNDNSGAGIIIETEADTLTKSMANDWGNFSDVLRDGYHHEPVRMSRRNGDEYVEVVSPAFSICLSGTPGQLKSLMGSTENGLFSRFHFYGFESAPGWRDMSPQANPVRLKPHFEELGQEVLAFHLKWNHQDVKVSWSEDQWKIYNSTFAAMYDEAVDIYGRETHDILCRLGNACLRMSVTLTVLKAFENDQRRGNLICDQTQFEVALAISKVLLQHSLLMFSNLPKREPLKVLAKTNFQEVLDSLPDEFKRCDAIKAGERFGIKKRTMGNYLQRGLNETLFKPKNGYYRKIN